MFEEIKTKLVKEKTNYMSPAEIRGRVYPEVLVTDQAPEGLKAAAGPDRIAYLIGTEPLQIEIPGVRGIYEVKPSDIIFEAAFVDAADAAANIVLFTFSILSSLLRHGFLGIGENTWETKLFRTSRKVFHSVDPSEFITFSLCDYTFHFFIWLRILSNFAISHFHFSI